MILAHLSEKNNTPDVAYRTVREVLEDCPRTREIQLYVAQQQEMVSNVR